MSSKKLSRDELVEIVRSIMEGPKGRTEEQLDALHQIVSDNVLDPHWTNYVYFHSPELTPEEVVDKALRYRPIQL